MFFESDETNNKKYCIIRPCPVRRSIDSDSPAQTTVYVHRGLDDHVTVALWA